MCWLKASFSCINLCDLFLRIMLLIGGLLLVGCSDCTGSSYSMPTIENCEQAPVLITDLTQRVDHRYYQLLNGQDCTLVVKGR